MIIKDGLFRPAAVSTYPFTWARFTGLFDATAGRALVEQFPSDELELHTSSVGSDKEYSVRSLTVSQDGKLTGPQLPQVWRQLVDDIQSSNFTTLIGRLSGTATRQDCCEIRLTEYERSYSMSPHTDRDDKLVTLVLYLMQNWQPGDGGELVILRSAAEQDVHAMIPPTIGSCAMIVRSPSSWHRVAAPTRSGLHRRALLVHFTRNEPKCEC